MATLARQLDHDSIPEQHIPMALRIHVPWGLLLTMLGFAGLGAAAAYWLATDFHGHLVRQCLLQAFRRGDYSAAIEQLSEVTRVGVNQSQNMKRQVAFTLPYTTASLVLAGRGAEAQALLASFRQSVGADFYYRLSAAYLQGLGGDVPGALDHLWQAQFERPALEQVSVPPPFQLLETCEKLVAQTGDARYRNLLIDLARRQRVYWPWSWAYAFEAKYATDPRERERALGIALYLDPQSEHLAGFSARERRLAGEWFAKNNPFKGK